jgi:carbamate kinase
LSRHELHEVPLDACGADSQGAIGYGLQQNLRNHLLARGVDRPVATVVTQVEVSGDDPAWAKPSKPIGSFMTAETAAERKAAEGWVVVEDAGRGWRRVVPSPEPLAIVEADVVRMLLDAGVIVITVGGGGIPVVRRPDGSLKGVDAVIDKDLASAMLATVIEAGLLVITTAVEKVALGWGTPQQRWVDRLTLAEAKQYLADGSHFAAGSMAPKIQACIDYLEAGGGEVLVTDPEHLPAAMRGETGTRIVP